MVWYNIASQVINIFYPVMMIDDDDDDGRLLPLWITSFIHSFRKEGRNRRKG